MGVNDGTLQALARQIGLALGLLEDELTRSGLQGLLAKLGLRLPDDLAAAGQVDTAAQAAASEAAALGPLVGALATAAEADDLAAILTASAQLLDKITATLSAVDALSTALHAAAATTALTEAQRAQLTAFVDALPARVLDYLVVRRLAESAPTVLATLDLAGLVDHAPVDVPLDDPLAIGHTRSELHFDRAGAALSAPAEHLRSVYGWGEPTFDALELFSRLQRVLLATGQVQADLFAPPGESPVLEAYLFGFQTDDSVSPPRLLVDIRFPGAAHYTGTYPLTPPWSIEVDAAGTFVADVRATITPPFTAGLVPPSGTVAADVTAGIVASPPDNDPVVVLLGAPGGTRLQARKASFEAGFAVSWDAANNQASGEPTLSLQLTDGHLILTLDGADGFLASVLPGTLDMAVNVDAEWRPSTGLVFHGGAALVVTIPVNLHAGPAHLSQLDLSLEVDSAALALKLRLSGDIALGPVTATASGLGAGVLLRFQRGNLGPVDLGFEFLPPTGLGLAIGAGPISGGGFLGYDPATGRYSGLFQVRAGTIGIGATGLLDTRLPSGPGYSLLVLLRATFPAIEVGFGFALTSVGGLLALNRSVDVDALRARLASGTAGRILAPEDPVRNAPVLLADLGTVFPATPGVVVVGPTMQLVWAELVRFDVGVFIELPGPRRVVLLGTALAVIDNPAGGRPLLQLRLDIVGELDLQKQTIAFDAVLIDSNLLEIFDLTGGAAFRFSYGAEPYVVLTAGGFFPGYSPAPLVFPASLTRLALTRGSPSDTLYLRFEGYFAVTTNTLQFGAAVQVIINLDPFNIQGMLSFDTLLQRDPFHFTVDIHASVHVRWRGHNIGGLDLSGELSGPGPVIFHGKVSFDILFFTISFEETFTLGELAGAAADAVADVLGVLAGELAAPGNVHALAAIDPWVTHAPAPSGGPPDISPVGQLVWAQRRAPLELLLQKVDGMPVTEPATIHASGPQVSGPDQDWFAPGAFITLSDAEALSTPSFERLQSGVRIGAAGTADGPASTLTVTVKQIRVPAPAITVGGDAFPIWFVLAGTARTGTTISFAAAPVFSLGAETWQVRDDASAVLADGLSEAQAHQLARNAGAAAVAQGDILPSLVF